MHQAAIDDDLYGSCSESIKHWTGQEYEEKLKQHLRNLGIEFQDENDLRKLKYDKTPDIFFQVPCHLNGRIVNWIESKALFGDEIIHAKCCENQLSPYWNRFGPGIVIYWFGFIEEIHSYKNVLEIAFVCQDFPQDLKQWDPSEEFERRIETILDQPEEESSSEEEEDDEDDHELEIENKLPAFFTPDSKAKKVFY